VTAAVALLLEHSKERRLRKTCDSRQIRKSGVVDEEQRDIESLLTVHATQARVHP
jgi:hypothetical protein